MAESQLRRLHELLDDARREIARVTYEPPEAIADWIEPLRAHSKAMGRVEGYLEAVRQLRPDLADEAYAAAEKLGADMDAMNFTKPGPGSDEPAP